MRSWNGGEFKSLYITGALNILASEVNPDPNIDAVEPSVAYRKNVALGYLYTVGIFIKPVTAKR